MLLHAARRAPRIFIVPCAHPVTVPMPPVSPPRLVRDVLPADAIVAVAREHAAVPVDPRTVAHRLECFRHAQSNPISAAVNNAAPKSEHKDETQVAETLAGAVAWLEPHAYKRSRKV